MSSLSTPEWISVAQKVAKLLESPGTCPVSPDVAPGEVRSRFSATPPEEGCDLSEILAEYEALIEPALTLWNHPSFLAYFATSACAAGVAAEALAAATNVNAMLWRTSPAATELELLACDWLRQAIGLGPDHRGHCNDTASTSTLIALAAARHRAAPEARQRGTRDGPELVIYCSDQAHSSVDKAAIVLGLGTDSVCRLPTDDSFRMDVRQLELALQRDRAEGRRAMAVVATVGTTSTGSVDPLVPILDLAQGFGAWLHVDAAYAGSAAVCPEYRWLLEGAESADSLVVNPHKWLGVPLGCSVLFSRGFEPLRAAFSLVPEYLTSSEDHVNLMDLGVALGRRFNGLKLWMVLRHHGLETVRRYIRKHCALARELGGRVQLEPGFELMAPVSMSVVCFRALPQGRGTGPSAADDAAGVDAFNRELLERVNRRREVLISHSELRGRTILRVAIGNMHTEPSHVRRAWELIVEEARALREEMPR